MKNLKIAVLLVLAISVVFSLAGCEMIEGTMGSIEGAIDGERGYFEYMNYSLFSSIRQALGKGKDFKNPFEKQVIEERKVPTIEDEKETIEDVSKIFGL